jgi:hypothetical protein
VRRETGKKSKVKVHYGEGLANHTDPEFGSARPIGEVRIIATS